jgi:hypothetical protein
MSFRGPYFTDLCILAGVDDEKNAVWEEREEEEGEREKEGEGERERGRGRQE